MTLVTLAFMLVASPVSAGGWKTVKPETLDAWMRTEQLTLVNVMSRIECLDHRIAGSLCIACEEFKGSLPRIPRDRKLVIYCESEVCTRSCLAADEAVAAGIKDVYVLEAGMPAWKAAGYRLESVQRVLRMPVSSVKASEFTAWMARHPEFMVLDIRSGDRFVKGHLEGAFNIPLHQLHERYHELPHDRALMLVDDQGFRSFLAASYLARKGFKVTRLFGGMAAWNSFSEGTRQVK
ncbi:MAG TPA: rhodanese-like domain-containing protein [Deltaproteobacteria bacterium]|jgi:rhodanese-related sulfurtransferase|nr:rhodanese-like domain-containing protein [Deltaproteobacteria bacterium]HNS88807.1 rhodanese-like domain-containing protein [Deltaproteobacteria bacterium]HOY74715.1 rhodanese-like domain-containing protein [Deltaproteobacteria bacterium]HPH50385.1 rhodanese-like domain-containing protein [Deltaproteobacteria bacterium]HPO31958.1 rhodanese-like domain-containing protein [Deltaproteobacteria bacterium]